MKTFIVPIIALWMVAGCGSTRREEPLVGRVVPDDRPTDPALVAGERLFMANCYQCHPNGRAGVAPALNNKPAPAKAIEFQIRHGLGAMPAFDDRRISNEQLHEISGYVIALRKQGRSGG
jgi:mono/diheme cytochrome c family protein